MNLPNAPVPSKGFLVTHFLTVSDQVKSRNFYAGILGGKVLAPLLPRARKPISTKRERPTTFMTWARPGTSTDPRGGMKHD